MIVTRNDIIRMLSKKTGYSMKDIYKLLKGYDDLLFDLMNEVTDDEEVVIQAFKGIRILCKILPERVRRNPKTQKDIVCKPQTKPMARFSEMFREKIQNQYDNKKLEDS